MGHAGVKIWLKDGKQERATIEAHTSGDEGLRCPVKVDGKLFMILGPGAPVFIDVLHIRATQCSPTKVPASLVVDSSGHHW